MLVSLRNILKSEKIIIIIFAFLSAAIIGYLFSQSLMNNIRWTVYLFFGPLFIFLYVMIKKTLQKFLIILISIFFIDGILFTKVALGDYVSLTLSFILGLFALIRFNEVEENTNSNTNTNSNSNKLIIWSLMLFFIASIIAVINGIIRDSHYASANVKDFISYYIGFLIFFFGSYKAFNKKEEVLTLMEVILIFSLLISAGHLFSMLTGIQLQSIRSDMADDRDLMGANWRYGGFLGNPNNLAAFYVISIPAAILAFLYSKKIRNKIISVFAIVSMSVSLFLLGSRGGLLFLALNLFISLFFWKFTLKKTIALATLLLIGAAITDQALDKYFSAQFEKTIKRFEKTGTQDIREKIWLETIDIIISNPMGLGISTYHFTDELKKRSGMTWSNPHNIYFEFAAQGGILMSVFFLMFAISSFIFLAKSFYKSEDTNDKLIFGMIAIILSGFILFGITEPIFKNGHKLNYFLAIVIGAGLNAGLKFNYYDKYQISNRGNYVAII